MLNTPKSMRMVLIFCLLPLLCSFCNAMELWGYKWADAELPPAPKLKNHGFKRGAEGWKLAKGYSIVNNSGRDGTTCLYYKRNVAEDYPLSTIGVELVSGARYRFGAWVKTENVSGDGSGGTCCLEFYRNGNYHSGIYPDGVKGTQDWTWITGEAVMPEDADKAVFALYLRPGMTGNVWFDDVIIEPVGQEPEVHVVYPACDTITATDGRVRVAVDCGTPGLRRRMKDFSCHFLAMSGDFRKEKIVPLRLGKAEINLSGAPEGGEVFLVVTLLDTGRKEIFKRIEKKIQVATANRKIPEGACFLDSLGRAIVDGKPFLPIGLYCFTIEKTDWDRIAESPFNFVMSYESLRLRPERSDPKTVENIHKTLDYLHLKGLKLAFSLKEIYEGSKSSCTSWHGFQGEGPMVENIVTNFRQHPALLAWYIADEEGVEMIPRLEERRRLVNRLDPFHPVWLVLDDYGPLPRYGSTTDIMGVDPYCLYNKKKSDSMAKVRFSMDMCRRTGLPVWGVTQAFNWGVYHASNDPEKFRKEYADPTEEQMRGISLMMALRGAKGFIFYSYNDLKKIPPLKPEDFDRRWPEVCRVGQMLKELEPFILSDSGLEKLKVSCSKGEVEACLFRSNSGEARVLLAGIGPGEAEATITLPAELKAKLKSLYGNTEYLGDNRYRFRGKDISSDILATER